MQIGIVREYCSDCKEITPHIYGTSMLGKKYVECEKCGKHRDRK